MPAPVAPSSAFPADTSADAPLKSGAGAPDDASSPADLASSPSRAHRAPFSRICPATRTRPSSTIRLPGSRTSRASSSGRTSREPRNTASEARMVIRPERTEGRALPGRTRRVESLSTSRRIDPEESATPAFAVYSPGETSPPRGRAWTCPKRESCPERSFQRSELGWVLSSSRRTRPVSPTKMMPPMAKAMRFDLLLPNNGFPPIAKSLQGLFQWANLASGAPPS